MDAYEPVKMNGEESTTITEVGGEEKDLTIKEATNEENTKEKEMIEEETDKGVKSETNIERDSKGRVNRLNKRSKRKRMALRKKMTKDNEKLESTNTNHTTSKRKMNDLGGSDVMTIEDANKLESLNQKGKKKKTSSDSNEVVDRNKLESLNQKGKKKTTSSDSNEVVLKSTEKPESSNKFSKKKMAMRVTNAVATKDAKEPKSSSKKGKMALTRSNEEVSKDSSKLKLLEKNKMEGIIFMCSSKTKKDCYRYKVLGLPASKKEIVLKIYNGMKLFLFDFDLKLMYGIYKAAGPGSYDIEPKAFKSEFPAQVRFTVLEDCLPVAEEKFKEVIKDNYYSKNKFNCQLTSEQVKNLCKLFRAASKGPKSKRLGRSLRAETHTSAFLERSGQHSRRAEARRFVDRERTRQQSWERERRPAFIGVDRYVERPLAYEREVFASPVLPSTLLPPLPQHSRPALALPSYAYERATELGTYRRDPLSEYHDRRFSDLELRHQVGIEHRDPYNLYTEHPLYHDPLYSAGEPIDYPLARQPPVEYGRPGLLPAYQHVSRPVAGTLPEQDHFPPLYRYLD
ncbi:hypothetical protein FH972_011514 [Carpinus fangiana]|uniref:DCD domain-containing protein n=1 Tax=Carpinus fangiana TaxID=176857 RepID=A0A660KRL0_9ROSI|nr:hypothetical protein FH972_011514 [Carpinus fangiana]KAE8039067.1 hypothetical protein FH972_011514 [Carpinus fangiana]